MRNAYKIIGKPEGKKTMEDIDKEKRITLKWILEKQSGQFWTTMHLDLDSDQWRDLVNTTMNSRFPKKTENFSNI